MPSARQVTTTNVISVRTDSTVRAVADILRPRASAPCPVARHRERGDLVHRAEIGTNARQQPTIGAPHSEGEIPRTRQRHEGHSAVLRRQTSYIGRPYSCRTGFLVTKDAAPRIFLVLNHLDEQYAGSLCPTGQSLRQKHRLRRRTCASWIPIFCFWRSLALSSS